MLSSHFCVSVLNCTSVVIRSGISIEIFCPVSTPLMHAVSRFNLTRVQTVLSVVTGHKNAGTVRHPFPSNSDVHRGLCDELSHWFSYGDNNDGVDRNHSDS